MLRFSALRSASPPYTGRPARCVPFENALLQHFADVRCAGKPDQRDGLMPVKQRLRQAHGFIDLVAVVEYDMVDPVAVDTAVGVDVFEIDPGTEDHVAPCTGKHAGQGATWPTTMSAAVAAYVHAAG